MDITLMRASVYDLPSRLRVDALVYDGSEDMQLWPGRGPDTDLDKRHGGGLQRALDSEVRTRDGKVLQPLEVARVIPGRLRCDFLAWVATRPPQRGAKPEPAPNIATIKKAVHAALAFAVERHVDRVGIGVLGAGPGEAPTVDRLIAIVEAAHAFETERAEKGLATPIEEVLVCTDRGADYRSAAHKVQHIAELSDPVARPTAKTEPITRRRVAGKTAPKPAGGGRARKLDRSSRRVPVKPRAPRKIAVRLDPAEIAAHRDDARYDMRSTYAEGDWFVHPKFGVGRVEEVVKGGSTPQVRVLFESGSEKRLVHGRG